MIYISFRDYPEDVFSDCEEFDSKEQASEWFNPQYHQWKKEGKQITILKEWPVFKDIPLYQGRFVKGYKVEEKGVVILWILITEQI